MDASKAQEVVRIKLTPAQAQEVKQATGREAEAIEFTVEELEQRIAPTSLLSQPIVEPSGMLAANCNETLLVD